MASCLNWMYVYMYICNLCTATIPFREPWGFLRQTDMDRWIDTVWLDIGSGACTQDLFTIHTTQNAGVSDNLAFSIPTAFCSMCRLILKHQVEALDRKIWSEKHVMLERKQQLAWTAKFILLSMHQAMNPALKQPRRVPFLKVVFGRLT